MNPIWNAIRATERPYVLWYRRIKSPLRSIILSLSIFFCVYPGVLNAHTYNISPNWPATSRIDGSAENQLSTSELNPHITASRGSRLYLPDKYSSISTALSPELLHRFWLLLLLRSSPPPPPSRILAVSNLYRRCRPPPATDQIIHYGARACTRHVARGEAWLRETGKRCGGRTGGSQTLLSSEETERERKREKERENMYMKETVCTYLWRSSLKDAHFTRLSKKK